MTRGCKPIALLEALLVMFFVLPLGAVTLESLEAGGTLTVGNVQYSNFTWFATCSVGGTPGCSSNEVSGLDPAAVDITRAIGLPSGENGFEITSPLSVTSDGTHNVVVDIILTYDATVVASSSLITDAYLAGADAFNPSRGQSPPSISVIETLTDLNTAAFLGQLEIEDPPADLSDLIDLKTATSSILVAKEITLQSGAGTYLGVPDNASLTTIIQATSLTATPEPRVYVFLLAGLLGAMVAIQRRRRHATQK